MFLSFDGLDFISVFFGFDMISLPIRISGVRWLGHGGKDQLSVNQHLDQVIEPGLAVQSLKHLVRLGTVRLGPASKANHCYGLSRKIQGSGLVDLKIGDGLEGGHLGIAVSGTLNRSDTASTAPTPDRVKLVSTHLGVRDVGEARSLTSMFRD